MGCSKRLLILFLWALTNAMLAMADDDDKKEEEEEPFLGTLDWILLIALGAGAIWW